MAKKNKGGGLSLQDQLKAAGLVTAKQVKKAKKDQHRKEMRVRQGIEVDESKIAAQNSLTVKMTKDLEKNKQRDQAAEAKAIGAQVKQLIEMNAKRQNGDISYNFTLDKKIKKIFISEENKKQLNKGFLAIVSFNDKYELVPEQVARKIMQRDSVSVVYLFERSDQTVDEDDPYKDFQIPDDLEW